MADPCHGDPTVTTRLLHLSDLHLSAQPGGGEVDADRSLALVLAACERLDDISAVVVTGDLADDGSVAAYERVRATLLDFATGMGAPLFVCPGNHDERDAFARVFGAGALGGRLCASTVVAGVRIVTLDSLVPGKWYGELGTDQLAWLAALLDHDPDVPTVVALHHPPFDLGAEIQRRVRLHDAERLADTITAGSVVAVLCGHFHQQISGSFGGVPVWVTPGVYTRIDNLSGGAGTETAVAGGSATLVDLTTPTAPMFAMISAADPAAGRLVYTSTLAELSADLAEFGRPA
jgi:Icc protein